MWAQWSELADGQFCGELTEEQRAGAAFSECTAPVNIAVIKYWGKRDEKLILPINDSLSVTLDQADLRTWTLVVASPHFATDRLWLNSKESPMDGDRMQACMAKLREMADPKFAQYKIHVYTENNFPTAAGLASSASGLACFVYSIAQAFGIQEQAQGDLSKIARMGSGSACRSLYGGFVAWKMGERADGEDSVAVQVAPESHWPELRALLLVVSDKEKGTPSTSGMKTSVDTSPLLNFRAREVVAGRMEEISRAILERDFDTFARITMQDSNQFHACCLDTYPPISYLSDTSRFIMALIHWYNDFVGETQVCYTFDAGPNAVLYTLEEHLAGLMQFLLYFFPPKDADAFDSYIPQPTLVSVLSSVGLDTPGKLEANNKELPASMSDSMPASLRSNVLPGALRYMLLTKAGPGPQTLRSSASN